MGTLVVVVVGGSVEVGACVVEVVEFASRAPDPSGDCATGDDDAGFGEHAASASRRSAAPAERMGSVHLAGAP
jgi:hypothetical protein